MRRTRSSRDAKTKWYEAYRGDESCGHKHTQWENAEECDKLKGDDAYGWAVRKAGGWSNHSTLSIKIKGV